MEQGVCQHESGELPASDCPSLRKNLFDCQYRFHSGGLQGSFVLASLALIPERPDGQSTVGRFVPESSTGWISATTPPADNSYWGSPTTRQTEKKNRLLTVAELYPEIVSSKRKEDDQPSCGAAEALTRQEPFINQTLAYHSLAMLTQLLRRGFLTYQGGFCNLATGQLVPMSVGHTYSDATKSTENRVVA